MAVSDKDAATMLHQHTRRIEIADQFVPRTILFPVEVEYNPGVKTPELRAFVTAGSYCSKEQWALALEYEKKYPALHEEYRKILKEQGRQVTAVEVKEKVTPIDLTR